MGTCKAMQEVIEYLNRGLRHELTAINQYWLHYRLLDNWGFRALAKIWRKESIEEMEHADKIMERIIFLDGFPNLQVLDPLHIGQNVKGSARLRSRRRDVGARALSGGGDPLPRGQGLRHPRPVREADARRGRAHRFPGTQLGLVAKLGVELYSQHYIGKSDDDHS
jgi:bacterioferritin